MRKPEFPICENKAADQLCSNCKADQHLCFHHTESTLLLVKSEISSFVPSVMVQTVLCQTWLEIPKTQNAAHSLSFQKLETSVSPFFQEHAETDTGSLLSLVPNVPYSIDQELTPNYCPLLEVTPVRGSFIKLTIKM